MSNINDEIYKCKKKLAFYINRWRRYPVSFYIEALQADKYGYPTLQQYEMSKIRQNSNFLAIRAGRGVGKSHYEASEICRHLLCYNEPSLTTKAIITGPSAAQLSDVSWAEVGSIHERMLPWLRDRFELTKENFYCKENPENWSAGPRTARKESPGSMFGIHGSSLNVFDEAPYIADPIFEVSIASFTQSTAYAIMSGNPDKLTGYFYRVFNTLKTRWKLYHIDCYDCLADEIYSYPYFDVYGDEHIIKVPGLVTREWIQDQIDTYGENSSIFQSHVRGNFPLNELNQIVESLWVERAWTNPHFESAERKRIMGVDPGDVGDSSAYCIRKGRNIEEVHEWSGQDPMKSSLLIKGRLEELKAAGKPVDTIVVDANGIGSGVASNLAHWKYRVKRVLSHETCPNNLGGTPCYRMRDWMWWAARNFYRDSKPRFVDKNPLMEKLAKELTIGSYKLHNGKIYVQPKVELRNLGYDSPNLADAHNLTFTVDWIKPKSGEAEAPVDNYRLLRKKSKRKRSLNWKTV